MASHGSVLLATFHLHRRVSGDDSTAWNGPEMCQKMKMPNTAQHPAFHESIQVLNKVKPSFSEPSQALILQVYRIMVPIPGHHSLYKVHPREPRRAQGQLGAHETG